jgi:tetraacyldisaccharide 4'-kinase
VKLGTPRHRLVHWLWETHGSARAARLALLPPALVYGAVMRARARGYQHGLFPVAGLPLPAVAVGNLSVGGTGKTPLAAWIARYCAERGRRPGILLRGYGADEQLVHERLVPDAVVVADPDRTLGARRAAAAGAQVLVLDDAYQLLSVARDLNVAVVSTESLRAASWPVPAGPWREGWSALERADCIVVTRKRASQAAAEQLAWRLEQRWPATPVSVAHLAVAYLEGMRSGTRHSADALRGRHVVAAAGIADPESFAVQVRASGAIVQLAAYQDHHAFAETEVEQLVQAAATSDYVVVTEKDAVKLRQRWPADAPEPLVAVLAVQWMANGRAIEQALDEVLALARS